MSQPVHRSEPTAVLGETGHVVPCRADDNQVVTLPADGGIPPDAVVEVDTRHGKGRLVQWPVYVVVTEHLRRRGGEGDPHGGSLYRRPCRPSRAVSLRPRWVDAHRPVGGLSCGAVAARPADVPSSRRRSPHMRAGLPKLGRSVRVCRPPCPQRVHLAVSAVSMVPTGRLERPPGRLTRSPCSGPVKSSTGPGPSTTTQAEPGRVTIRPMATWILVGGCVVLALILGTAVLLVFLLTRDGAEQDDGLSRFKWRDAQSDENAVPPAADD